MKIPENQRRSVGALRAVRCRSRAPLCTAVINVQQYKSTLRVVRCRSHAPLCRAPRRSLSLTRSALCNCTDKVCNGRSFAHMPTLPRQLLAERSAVSSASLRGFRAPLRSCRRYGSALRASPLLQGRRRTLPRP